MATATTPALVVAPDPRRLLLSGHLLKVGTVVQIVVAVVTV